MISLLDLFQNAKRDAHSLAMIALYDAPSAQLACDANADMILVGDSMGNVILGFDDTTKVLISDIARHTGAVVRGVAKSTRRETPVVADLPFATYDTPDDALRNSALLMNEGAHAVKLEGASESSLAAIRVLVANHIPVIGHIGFTPQSAAHLSGVVQGKTFEGAKQLLDEAQKIEDTGAIAIVLEAMPSVVAQEITRRLRISTIGIGAGVHCDAQVLVWHDLVGFSSRAPFRFVKRFAQIHDVLLDATTQFVAETHDKNFPDASHEYAMPDEELRKWQQFEPKRRGVKSEE